jgi:hypothetical protein
MVDTTRTTDSVSKPSENDSRDGAPAKPSPEMIRAGAEVIWQCFDETIPWGSSFGEHVAQQVFEAMIARSDSK